MNWRKTIICENCMRVVTDATAVQRYCKECSAEKDRIRKAAWAAAHQKPKTEEQKANNKRQRAVDRSGYAARGAETSHANRRSIDWYADSEPDVNTLFRISFPFSYHLSKNKLWSSSGTHVFMRSEIKSARDGISFLILNALRRSGFKIKTGKIWIDILVQKPDHKGDAVNVLDLICDAAKVALGVDDRWFSVRRLDWEIVKKDPLVYLGISQEVESDQRVCSYCGRQLSLDMFKGARRECADCRRAA